MEQRGAGGAGVGDAGWEGVRLEVQEVAFGGYGYGGVGAEAGG